MLTDKYRLQISGADQSIRAVLVRGEEASILDVDDGAAGLLVTSVGYLTGRRAAVVGADVVPGGCV